jgi:CDGSH-type Zn-finger protein
LVMIRSRVICEHCGRWITQFDNNVWFCECGYSQHNLALDGQHHDEYSEIGEVHFKFHGEDGKCTVRSI